MSTEEVPTVFIIDDDRSIRESVRDLLESVGLHCEDFATAQAFLNRERNHGPSCLILDVRLPGISGLDLQQELRKATISIPIIFITAHADIPMTVQAMKSGAVEFLTKPFRQQDLLDAVRRSLDRDGRAREKKREIAELRQRYNALTAREREVMSLVFLGCLTSKWRRNSEPVKLPSKYIAVM
jgi:FixJ family two-component response regulator